MNENVDKELPTIDVCVRSMLDAPQDAWITLPLPDSELTERLKDLQAVDKQGLHYMIVDYDGFPLGCNYGRTFNGDTSLLDLNLLAKQMQLNPEGVERLTDIVGTGELDEFRNINEVMNALEQVNEYPYYRYDFQGGENVKEPVSKYAWTLIEGDGADSRIKDLMREDPAFGCAFDVKRYGEESSYDVGLGEYGYLDCTQGELFPKLDKYNSLYFAETVNDAWEQKFGHEQVQEQTHSAKQEYSHTTDEQPKTDVYSHMKDDRGNVFNYDGAVIIDSQIGTHDGKTQQAPASGASEFNMAGAVISGSQIGTSNSTLINHGAADSAAIKASVLKSIFGGGKAGSVRNPDHTISAVGAKARAKAAKQDMNKQPQTERKGPKR